MSFLRKADAAGYKQLWITRDPDLDGLRSLPEFMTLVEAAKKRNRAD